MTSIKQRLLSFFRHSPRLIAIGYAIWRRFQAKYSIGAVGVVINSEGRVLLVEHALHPKYIWGLPGGWVGRNENPAAAVRRELREELSLDVEIETLLLAETPFKNHLDLIYLCRANSEIGALSYELLSYRWFVPNELPKILDVHRRAIEQAIQLRQHSFPFEASGNYVQ